MHKKSICILLPALNEGETIGQVIDKIPRQKIAGMGYDLDIMVVDGHSVDMTGEIAQSKGARLVEQKGHGKGDAVKTAFESFEGQYLFMLDADNTYDPDTILKMLPLLEKNDYDVLLGSRLNGSVKVGAMTTLNYIGNRTISSTANFLFPNGHTVTDVCTGMWGFRDEVIDTLVLDAEQFDIEAELYAKCIKHGFRIGELPIHYHRRPNETKLSSLKDGYKIMMRLLKERVRDTN